MDRSFFLIKVILLLYKYTTQLFKCFLRKLSLCLLWSQEKWQIRVFRTCSLNKVITTKTCVLIFRRNSGHVFNDRNFLKRKFLNRCLSRLKSGISLRNFPLSIMFLADNENVMNTTVVGLCCRYNRLNWLKFKTQVDRIVKLFLDKLTITK